MIAYPIGPLECHCGGDLPQDCLKGRYFCHKLTEEDLHKGVAHFNAALAQNPDCALRFRGTGGRVLPVCIAEHGAAGEVYPRAKEMALSALRAQQDLGDAHAVAGQREEAI